MKEVLSLIIVFACSYLVKIHRIEKGNFVTWDEAHFGKFAQKYLSRIFYFDVHPPLGKMLTALSGLITGQSNKFDFGSSAQYPVTFDYVGMRRFHSFIASFTPLFAFLILREFKFSLRKALVLSFLFILENGVVSISRLILLDSHLITFTSATIYVLTLLFTRVYMANPKKHLKEHNVLLLLGICIGCVMSIKWIGCLTTLQVGLFIIFDLSIKLVSMDLITYSKYFLKRVFFLICIPCTIYVGMFYLHFHIVNQTGPDDGFMSSEFQLSLKGNTYKDLKKYVSYGNQVTIRTTSGYLHSHLHSYPDYALPSKGKAENLTPEELKLDISIPMQVTTYSHSDSNNNFYFQKLTDEGDADFVNDNDQVALLHNETKGYIQQTNETAYMSEGYKIIGNRKEGLDPMAVWIVEIKSDSVYKEKRLKAVSSKFYLKNKETHMYLSASTMKYPTWGFSQGEIIAIKEKDSTCVFNLQENFFSNAAGNEPYVELKPSFIKRFLEHQKVMFSVNKSFVADSDLAPESIVSKPIDWLLLVKGIRMSQWHEQYKFYMFMNPIIHYSAVIGLFVAPFFLYLKYVLRQRKRNVKEYEKKTATQRIIDEIIEVDKCKRMSIGNETENINKRVHLHQKEYKNTYTHKNNNQSAYGQNKNNKNNYFESGAEVHLIDEKSDFKQDETTYNQPKPTKTTYSNISFQTDAFFLFLTLGGWAIHYIPFFIVGRVLYLHHYFPALFFATLNLCYFFKNRSLKFCTIFVAICGLAFFIYSPLTYGFLDPEKMKKFKVFKSWNFTDK